MTVLLVDDSPVMRRFVARTLEMTGLGPQIHEAENGRDGMSKAVALVPDLVITDLNMPEMDGAELIAEMQASKLLCGIPVLVLTADRSPVRSEALMGAGAAACLTKPITPQSLRKELLSLLAEVDR